MIEGQNNVAMLPVHIVEEEPRVLDTDLAKALGMRTAANIRKDIIAPNRQEIESLGLLGSSPINAGGRGRPGTAYYLNEEQALLVCMLSRTERAKQVRGEVIRVFVAWRRGEIGPNAQPEFDLLPPPSFASETVTRKDLRDLCEWLSRRFAAQNDEVERRIESRLTGFVKAIADQVWYGAGHLKKHLLSDEALAKRGLMLLPSPTPDTTFLTVHEIISSVIPEDSRHPALGKRVGPLLNKHALRHQWPQGETEQRSPSLRPVRTYPKSRSEEWINSGGKSVIERENEKLLEAATRPRNLRLI